MAVAAVGTGASFLAALVLVFFLADLRAADALVWLWSCLAAGVVGLLGMGLASWQQRSRRDREPKGAQGHGH